MTVNQVHRALLRITNKWRRTDAATRNAQAAQQFGYRNTNTVRTLIARKLLPAYQLTPDGDLVVFHSDMEALKEKLTPVNPRKRGE